MKLIAFCVRYPITVIVGMVLALLFGVIALTRLPIQMTPTVDRPEISVETVYRGAAPQEVENEIVDRQEEKLISVQNLQELVSTSYEGRGVVTLRFDWGVNKDVARLEVSEKLDLVQDIPDDAERPIIRAVSSDEETPIAWIVINTKRDINEVRQEAEDAIKPRLERVEGVGAVWLFGGQEREVHVMLDYQAMTARGLTISQVRDALLRENRNTKGGNIDEGKRRYLVRTIGQFADLKHIEDTIVATQGGHSVYVRDIATVRFGLKERDRSIRLFGDPTVGFGVVRRTGANTVEVMKGLKQELAYLNSVYADKGIKFEQVYDETDYIYDAVSLVTENVYAASLLTMVVLIFFLRSLRSILVIGLSIPISVVTTFIILNALGRSLNIVMLAGLAFAVGNIVDNSIVVLENIFRHREMGKSRLQAALDGASEVRGAIVASTLTNLAVFLPIILMQDEVGQLFRDIAIATSISTVLSLSCALTVVPMMASRVLKTGPEGARYPRLQRLLDIVLLGWLGQAFSNGLMRSLSWLRRGVGRRLAVVFGMTLGSLALALYLMPPIDYLPKGNRNLILAIVQLPPGFNLDQIDGIVTELESRYMQMPEIARLFAVARTENPLLGVIVKREYADIAGIQRVIEELKRRSTGIPGTRAVFVTQMALFRQRGQLLGGTNLEIDVKGHGLDEVRDIAAGIEQQVRSLPGVNFVRSSFEWGNPELQVAVDRQKVSDLGFSVSDIGYMVETLIAGTLAGNFREQGKERDLTLIGTERGAARTQALDNVVLYPPRGGPLRLADIADIREEEGPTKIEHIDRDRSIKLTVNLRDEVPMQEAIDTVNTQVLRKVRQELPLGYAINVSGQAKDLDRTWNSLKWSFLLAVVVIYLLMCSLYESFTYPFIIMFSVPPAMVGGVLGVRLLHHIEPMVKLDVVTMLGFIIMAGVVVNAAILLVEQALNHMQEGMHPQDAILESARNRLRPIFMTASSILGFLPLVASSGAGSELYRGMGAVMLGGMALSTVFTLVLVPTMFSLWIDAQAGLLSLLGRKPKELNGNGSGHGNGNGDEVALAYRSRSMNDL
ncbi:MAG TPA: efflux RND transporter permease subunit [Candidatus Tectomicrobia bacterium]|nr:efflux RND transporter permease subunit [Candidatus Tectomicrobia bacterium]